MHYQQDRIDKIVRSFGVKCRIHPASSRMCGVGTKCCIVNHRISTRNNVIEAYRKEAVRLGKTFKDMKGKGKKTMPKKSCK